MSHTIAYDGDRAARMERLRQHRHRCVMRAILAIVAIHAALLAVAIATGRLG